MSWLKACSKPRLQAGAEPILPPPPAQKPGGRSRSKRSSAERAPAAIVIGLRQRLLPVADRRPAGQLVASDLPRVRRHPRLRVHCRRSAAARYDRGHRQCGRTGDLAGTRSSVHLALGNQRSRCGSRRRQSRGGDLAQGLPRGAGNRKGRIRLNPGLEGADCFSRSASQPSECLDGPESCVRRC